MANIPPPPPGEVTTQARVTNVARGLDRAVEAVHGDDRPGIVHEVRIARRPGELPGLEIEPARLIADQVHASSPLRSDGDLLLILPGGLKIDELAGVSGIDDEGLLRRNAGPRVRHLSGPLALFEEVAQESALGIELQHLILVGQEERAPRRGPQLARPFEIIIARPLVGDGQDFLRRDHPPGVRGLRFGRVLDDLAEAAPGKAIELKRKIRTKPGTIGHPQPLWRDRFPHRFIPFPYFSIRYFTIMIVSSSLFSWQKTASSRTAIRALPGPE